QLIAVFQFRAVLVLDPGSVRDQLRLGLAGLVISHDDLASILRIIDSSSTCKFCDDRKSRRLSCLKKLFDTGKTLCDIVTGHTTGMEGTHGQLGTRLSDGLCGDNTYSLTYLYRLAGRHVGAVALRADTAVRTAGQDGTDLDLCQRLSVFIHTFLCDQLSTLRCNHVVCFYQHIAVFIFDIFAQIASCDTLL